MEREKIKMIDVFEQKNAVNLSTAEIRTLLIALENLPEDEKGLEEVMTLYDKGRKPSKELVEITQFLRTILKHRLTTNGLLIDKPAMLAKMFKKSEEDEEYEEI